MPALSQERKDFGFLDIIIVVLSIYILVALTIDTLVKLPAEVSRVLKFTDNIICAIFFIEFSYRFSKAESKLKFMQWGWIDLLACIPMVDFLRAGRAFRLIRLLRIIRAFRSTKNLVEHIFASRAKGAFTSVFVIAILLLLFSSIAILQVEDDPNSNIKTAEDAIWWSYVTITTVGYGDKYPVTTEGRILAAIVMTAGIGMFGTFTAFIASWFVKERKENEQKERNEKGI